MHNYRSNQSALMTRCGTDLRHQYGIFGGKSQTSVSRNATRPGVKKDGCFRRLVGFVNLFAFCSSPIGSCMELSSEISFYDNCYHNAKVNLLTKGVSIPGFKWVPTNDASFSNVRVLADASSCKAANKSTI